MPQEVLKVAITDDHPIVLQGIVSLLQDHEHIAVTGTYRSGEALLEGLAADVPDILLLDMQLTDTTGDELTPRLLELFPGLQIIVLTNFDSPMYASKMLYLGARGYLLKTSEDRVFLEAIRTVAEGETYVDQQLKQKMKEESFRSQTMLTSKSTLTARELEIIQLIVDGYKDQEIAEKLFLGLNTIKHYRMSILLKLDVRNTASLVAKALKTGLAR